MFLAYCICWNLDNLKKAALCTLKENYFIMYFFISRDILAEFILSNLPKLLRDIIAALITIDKHARGIVTGLFTEKVQCFFLYKPAQDNRVFHFCRWTLLPVLRGKNSHVTTGTWVWITMRLEWVYPSIHMVMTTWGHVQVCL